jgi:hypothetical protein
VSNPTANPIVTTTYTVTSTNTSSGCVATDQLLITVNTTIPLASAGQDFTKNCTQNQTGLSIGQASQPGIIYNWSPTIGLSSSTISNPTANPTATTTFTLTATNPASGCVATDQMVVTVNETSPVANAGADQSLCAGQTTVLQASGNAQYTWDNNVNNGVAFAPGATNTYTLTATDLSSGCASSDQVIITVNALPAVNAGLDQSLCSGATATLSATGAFTYSWTNGVSNGLAFAPTSTSIYSVTGTDANGCIGTDQVLVTVNALPSVNAGVDQTVGAGTSVSFS